MICNTSVLCAEILRGYIRKIPAPIPNHRPLPGATRPAWLRTITVLCAIIFRPGPGNHRPGFQTRRFATWLSPCPCQTTYA